VSATRIVLSFRAPDAGGGQAARRYLVKQSLSPISSGRAFKRARALCGGSCRFDITSVGTRVTLAITDLAPNTTYYYAIAARDNTTGRPGPRSKTAKATTK